VLLLLLLHLSSSANKHACKLIEGTINKPDQCCTNALCTE
jgi:hypothetical protein